MESTDEKETEFIDSWSKIVSSAPDAWIETTAERLFSKSKWRIGKLNEAALFGTQKNEPFMLIKGNKTEGWLYGTADNLRNDERLIIGYHINSFAIEDYISKYAPKDPSCEPHNGFLSIESMTLYCGSLCLSDITPILTEKQWIKRDKIPILELICNVQKHIIKQKDSQLHELASKQAISTIMDLKVENYHNFQIIIIKFLNNAVFNFLNNKNVHQIKGKNQNKPFICTLPPNYFFKYFKDKIIKAGGRQTSFTTGERRYILENVSNEVASNLLVQRRKGKLSKSDEHGREYRACKVSLHYSEKTIFFGITYTIYLVKNGKIHAKN